MAIKDKAKQAFVKVITTNSVIATVCDLEKVSISDLTEGDVKRSAAPVEDENELPVEFGHTPCHVLRSAKVPVKCRQRLVHKLMDLEPSAPRGTPKFAAGSARQGDWNRHD